MKLKPQAWVAIVVIAGAIGYFSIKQFAPDLFANLAAAVAPAKPVAESTVPPEANLPELPKDAPLAAPTPVAAAPMPGEGPGCANLGEVRAHIWAWNAQMGWMFANGGVQSTAGSLMCQRGVNLKLLRQDDVPKMREALIAFATDLQRGNANPTAGVHFVAIMGDGVAGFIQPLNVELAKFGMRAQVIGSAGWSRGEDKFMGLPEWRTDPQKARGALVAGYVGDGDWNIAIFWASRNDICNNPDWTTYDPECLNWVNAENYVDAAQKYVMSAEGYCEERPVVRKGKKTGDKQRVCVNGVVTWTPGDVTVAERKGGLVSVLSTKENASQMPNTIIGVDRWMQANRSTVESMLAAIFAGSDQVKQADGRALARAAAISATVYGEQDAAYWEKYFYGVSVRDAKGLSVELGGSAVNNLADNLYLFGMNGGTNLFEATYLTFGNFLQHYHPDMLPSVPPVREILDTSYLAALAQREQPTTKADTPVFTGIRPVTSEQLSSQQWRIEFASGSDAILPSSQTQLEQLQRELAIATKTMVDLEGHTDTTGDVNANQDLSLRRAHAIQRWLQERDGVNFPAARFRVTGFGESRPIKFPETTAADKAVNRRVEIITHRTAS
ncbi:OmpA family protein [Candidatus Uhrbacteria bacterium]|nr:OmpA family protein [Candidatus Uhrbacteria bacterium]